MPRGRQDNLPPRERVDRFLRRVEDLQAERLVADKLTVSLNVTGGREGIRLTLGGVDREDLRSFLVTFRLFISNDEPVFMDKIFNLCRLHLADEAVKRHIADARSQWNMLKRQDSIQGEANVTAVEVVPPTWQLLGLELASVPRVPPVPRNMKVRLTAESDGVPVTWHHATDLVINTTFHDDQDLLTEWNHFTSENRTIIEAMFRFYVVRATAIILWLGNTVRVALKQGLLQV